MHKAQSLDIYIDQGATFSDVLKTETNDSPPVTFPLTGFVAAAQIRSKYSASIVLASLTCVVDEAAGTVTISLTAAQTAALDVVEATGVQKKITQYAWDLKITNAGTGEVIRLVEGNVNVSPAVTR